MNYNNLNIKRIKKEKILKIIELEDKNLIIKAKNHKGPNDFVIKIFNPSNNKLFTPKHAHFVIDLYGKFCKNSKLTIELFSLITKIYNKENPENILRSLNLEKKKKLNNLPGYKIDYILYCLDLIFQQEDINYPPPKFKGRKLAYDLLYDVIINKVHPVEAMLKTRLKI